MTKSGTKYCCMNGRKIVRQLAYQNPLLCILSLFFIFLGGLVMLGFGVDKLEYENRLAENRDESFAETTCFTITANKSEQLRCYYCLEGAGCNIDFPCLQLKVQYAVNNDSEPTESYILERSAYRNVNNCMVYYGYRCIRWEQPDQLIDTFYDQYGSPGTNFTCHYDQNNPSMVELRRFHRSLWYYILLPLGGVLAVFGFTTFVYFQCTACR